MSGWIFDLAQAAEGEEVLLVCQVGDGDDFTRLLARLHWFEEGATRVLTWQATNGGMWITKLGLKPYAFRRLETPPAPSEIEF